MLRQKNWYKLKEYKCLRTEDNVNKIRGLVMHQGRPRCGRAVNMNVLLLLWTRLTWKTLCRYIVMNKMFKRGQGDSNTHCRKQLETVSNESQCKRSSTYAGPVSHSVHSVNTLKSDHAAGSCCFMGGKCVGLNSNTNRALFTCFSQIKSGKTEKDCQQLLLRSLQCLERYIYLILFNTYLHLEKKDSWQRSFTLWMEQVKDLTAPLLLVSTCFL